MPEVENLHRPRRQTVLLDRFVVAAICRASLVRRACLRQTGKKSCPLDVRSRGVTSVSGSGPGHHCDTISRARSAGTKFCSLKPGSQLLEGCLLMKIISTLCAVLLVALCAGAQSAPQPLIPPHALTVNVVLFGHSWIERMEGFQPWAFPNIPSRTRLHTGVWRLHLRNAAASPWLSSLADLAESAQTDIEQLQGWASLGGFSGH